MANSPIEIMVKLTYNIDEVVNMAEFCPECWKNEDWNKNKNDKNLTNQGSEFIIYIENKKKS